MNCPHCTAEVPDDSRFCEECGKPVGAPGQGCPKCGVPLDQVDEEGFCSACGFRIEARGRDHLERVISPRFAGVTDRGLRHHRNEDAMGLEWIEDGGAALMVICDGVSSTADADRASELAAETALRSLIGAVLRERETHETAVALAIEASQKAVAALGDGRSSPATTIVCAIVKSDSAVIGWVGDSRAYWITPEKAEQITSDHSWMCEVVAAGEMNMEQATASPSAHAITRWLGADAPQDAGIPTVRLELTGPGQLLLCTDGLWNYAPEAREIAGLISGTDAISSTRAMIEFANGRGGQDNITAVLFSTERIISDQANVSIQS